MPAISLGTRIWTIQQALKMATAEHLSVSVPNLKALVRAAERSVELEEENAKLKERIQKKVDDLEEVQDRMKRAKRLLQTTGNLNNARVAAAEVSGKWTYSLWDDIWENGSYSTRREAIEAVRDEYADWSNQDYAFIACRSETDRDTVADVEKVLLRELNPNG